MSLITSISGIRGTIGGVPGQNLTPLDVVQFASAYAHWAKAQGHGNKILVGRDARPSGEVVSRLVTATLAACGLHVVDLGLTTTPTLEMAVPAQQAAGGIILTASHNPIEWNALKLVNHLGEFISAEDGAQILETVKSTLPPFAEVLELGGLDTDNSALHHHIDAILALPWVNQQAIQEAHFKIAVDGINSSGGIAVPLLLRRLGVLQVVELNCSPNGLFAHNPEPLADHLKDICLLVQEQKLDMGIVVDPDVDRLAFISEDGRMFGEEYTLVAVADYLLQHKPGPVVSNLSSSRALADLAARYGQPYYAAAVGEVNVVKEMKARGAVLGGEGNGGIILPDLHYGRDALVGIAIFLSHLAQKKMKMSDYRATLPEYHMAKLKIEARPGMNLDAALEAMAARYHKERIDQRDGVKIDFADSWVHLRRSNTEPIIRIYTEAATSAAALALGQAMQDELGELLR